MQAAIAAASAAAAEAAAAALAMYVAVWLNNWFYISQIIEDGTFERIEKTLNETVT